MKINIRKAEPEDYFDVHEIHEMVGVYSGTLQLPLPSKELWRKRLSEHPNHVNFYVAEVDGKVVAFSGLDLNQNVRRRHAANLWITVHDDWQNKGIGKHLMQTMLDSADNWLAVLRIELTVFVDNHPAIRLYENMGFVKEGIHKSFAFRNGKYEDVVAMARIRNA